MDALDGHHLIDSYVFTVTYVAWIGADNHPTALGGPEPWPL